ncbi:Ras-GAP domain-containing protein [Entamoeba marina]
MAVHHSKLTNSLANSYNLTDSTSVIFDSHPESTPQSRRNSLKSRANPVIKKPHEQSLRELFFENNNSLLYAYCDTLIKNDVNPYYIEVLMDFWSSRGKLVDLMLLLAKREILNENPNNQLFRGNTIFSKVYAKYLSSCCNSYLNETSNAFVEFITESYDEQGIQEVMKNDNLKGDMMSTFSELLLDNIHLIPSHFRVLLQTIYSLVMKERGEEHADKTFITLLFLRYLFIPFVKTPSVLISFQKCMSEAFTKTTTPSILNTYHMEEVKKNVKYLIASIKRGPAMHSVSLKGVSMQKQEKSLNQILEVIKREMKNISRIYDGDFSVVFSAVKGRVDCCTGGYSIPYAMNTYVEWLEEKEKNSWKTK